MSGRVPVLKFGGRVLQGYHRFGLHEDQLLHRCQQLDSANEIYRLLQRQRNRARAERLREIAKDYILPLCEEGLTPVIVVSAFDWATDKLDQLSTFISPQPVKREYARLLMSGELRANSSLAMALEEQGHSAYSMTGREAGICTKDGSVGALIERVEKDYLVALINQKVIPVVAGFQGYYYDAETERDQVAILGRGGSNLTAVALAAALGQSQATMYSDVDGIYDRDPLAYSGAQRFDEVAGRELLEWSEFPRVIQKEAVEYALEQRVDIWIRSGFDPQASGTLIKCSQ